MNETQQRLLDRACEVFAEKGFAESNVSEICERAKANIASINYYFGGKKKLYLEVLRYAADCSQKEFPLVRDVSEFPEPEKRMAEYIRTMFQRGSSDGPAGYFSRLVAREASNPSFAQQEVFVKLLRPNREYLFGMLRELLPANASEAHVGICAHNVIGLVSFFNATHAKEKLRKKTKFPLPPPDELHRFATTFALGGIRAIAKEVGDSANPSPRTRTRKRK